MADDEVRWVSSVKFFPPRDSSTQDASSRDNSRWFFFLLIENVQINLNRLFFSTFSCASPLAVIIIVIIITIVLVDFMAFHEKWDARTMDPPVFFRPGSCSKRLTVIERYALLVRFVLVKLCREMIVVVRDRRLDDRLIRRRTILIY